MLLEDLFGILFLLLECLPTLAHAVTRTGGRKEGREGRWGGRACGRRPSHYSAYTKQRYRLSLCLSLARARALSILKSLLLVFFEGLRFGVRS